MPPKKKGGANKQGKKDGGAGAKKKKDETYKRGISSTGMVVQAEICRNLINPDQLDYSNASRIRPRRIVGI